jgi:hypothetical protein
MDSSSNAVRIKIFKDTDSAKAVIHHSFDGPATSPFEIELIIGIEGIEILFVRYAVEQFCDLNGVLRNLVSNTKNIGSSRNTEEQEQETFQAEVIAKVMLDAKLVNQMVATEIRATSEMILASMNKLIPRLKNSEITSCIIFVQKALLDWERLATGDHIELFLSQKTAPINVVGNKQHPHD